MTRTEVLKELIRLGEQSRNYWESISNRSTQDRSQAKLAIWSPNR